MSRAIQHLDWKFSGDDGFWYADGFSVGYEIAPSQMPDAPAVFKIQRRSGERGQLEPLGTMHSLENAKWVCDLVENG